MNAPAWRIWLVVVLLCAWGILTIRFLQQEQWPMAALTALMAVTNGVTLWRLTKNGR